MSNLQERLCAYVSRRYFARLTPAEFRGPWTYTYREWTDEDKATAINREGRCCECTGVVIALENGTQLRIAVADMLAEQRAG
jgi:hypothetical protein